MENEIVVVKNGVKKFRFAGKILADGSIRVLAGGKWMPVTNSDACTAAGLEPKSVARAGAPLSCLAHMGDNGYGLMAITGSEYDSAERQKRVTAQAALELAVPGIAQAISLAAAAYNESERYSKAFSRMMEDENNDGAIAPRPEDCSIRKQLTAHLVIYPRAALYLKAKHQNDGAHWADNTGAGLAGRKAMEILASAGSIEDAAAALAVRREFVD